MTNTKNSLIMLVCLLSLSSIRNQRPASVRALGIENRPDNVIEMTADDGHPQASEESRYPRNEVDTLTDKLKEDLKTSSESAITCFVAKMETEEMNRNSNTHCTANNSSQEETKDLTKPTLHSLSNNHTDIDDVFPEESRIGKLSDAYCVNFIDEFHCQPCKCYSTIFHDIVVSCNRASLDQINAVLPNETQQLTISYCQITVFNATDFLQYHILKKLTLSKNTKISTISNSSNNYLMLTVEHLDLSFNSIKNIMDRSFVMFSNLLNLSLEYNHIRNIFSFTFEGLSNLRFLNLSHNPLSVLPIGSLDHLQKLEILDLSCSRIWKLITPGLLSNLASLHQLYINGNWTFAKSYPNEEIARLRNLTSLSIDGISELVTLGPQINNLTKLVTLHVGFSKRNKCGLKHITESFLENVPYLQTVRFSNCNLTSVDPNVYRNVKDLRSLEFVSTYPYDIFKALDGLSGLQNSSLKSLRLIKLIKDGCPFICLFGRHAKYLENIDLEVIDVSHNKIGFMDAKFLSALPRTLRALLITGNELIEPSLLTDKLFFLQHLHTIDLSVYKDPDASNALSQTQANGEVFQQQARNGFSQSEISSGSGWKQWVNWVAETDNRNQEEDAAHKTNDLRHPKPSHSEERSPECRQLYDNNDGKDNVSVTEVYEHRREPYLPNITSLHNLLAPGLLEIDTLKLFKSISAYTYTNLRYIDFSYCALPSLSMTCRVPASIQVAIFNGNYFRQMYEQAFHLNNSLTYLSLRNNLLGDIIASKDVIFFIRLKNLVYLDISMNMMYELPPNFFQGLTNLKYLIMKDNKLGLLNTNFSTTPKLEYLDLRKNSISSISKSSRDELDIIGTNHPLYIELTSNPLRCTCEGLEMLHWIWVSNINFLSKDLLSCVRDDGRHEYMGNIADRVRSLQRQCAGKSLIIVLCVSILVVICFIVVFGVLYRYRWQLRYIQNIALSRFIGYKPRDTECTEYRFDAFIVYSDMSRRFVFDNCLQELEVKRGHKLCVDDRDFMPGTYDVSAIVSAIQNSRKTVLILSPDFYEGEFSEYSVKMALMEEIYKKKSILYLCVYRPLPDDEMYESYDLLMIMNRNNYMEFPPERETSDEIRDNFWDQLSEKIGHSVREELSYSVD